MKRFVAGLAAAALLSLAAHRADAQLFHTQSFTLPNGLQVVLIESHRTPAVSNMVFYKVGADDEVPGKTGLAHMLEHMMFQGTKTVAPNQFSSIVAAVGGEDNAYTTADYTAFFQQIGSNHLDLVLKLEADRMQNLNPQAAQFATEHQAVLEELRMRVENSPESELFQQMEASLFLNAPYHHPVIGWRPEVEGLNLDDVKAWYGRWYAPNNAVLAVSGDVTLDRLKQLATQYFGAIPKKTLPTRVNLVEPTPIAARTVELRDPNVHQPQWSRLYMAPSYSVGDRQSVYALQLLANIMGGGSTSRLYRGLVLSGKQAVAASADYDPEARSLGTFSIGATPAPGTDLNAMSVAIDQQVKNILTNGVTPEEVARAKQRFATRLAYMQDSYSAGARLVGTALASGQSIQDVESWPQRVAAVTADQVNAAAKAVLRDERSVTGRLLPAAPGEATTAEQPASGPPSPSQLGRQLR